MTFQINRMPRLAEPPRPGDFAVSAGSAAGHRGTKKETAKCDPASYRNFWLF